MTTIEIILSLVILILFYKYYKTRKKIKVLSDFIESYRKSSGEQLSLLYEMQASNKSLLKQSEENYWKEYWKNNIKDNNLGK